MEKKYLSEELVGSKIVLKKHEPDLAGKMFEYVDRDRERLGRFLPWVEHTKTVDDEIKFIEISNKEWVDHQGANYGIYRKADNEYLGNVGALGFDWMHESCEIGYWILGGFEGQGYMRDAVTTLERALFEIGFNRIVIRCEPENQRSKNIPLSLGYSLEGTLREIRKDNNRYINLEIYSKLKSEYSP